MTEMEKDFLNDIKDAVDEFDPEYEKYHSDGYFNVDITVSLKTWEEDGEEIWDRLSEVGEDWGVTPDSDTNEYYMSIESDREEDDDYSPYDDDDDDDDDGDDDDDDDNDDDDDGF